MLVGITADSIVVVIIQEFNRLLNGKGLEWLLREADKEDRRKKTTKV